MLHLLLIIFYHLFLFIIINIIINIYINYLLSLFHLLYDIICLHYLLLFGLWRHLQSGRRLLSRNR
jgi:hypothetical protein